MTTEEATFLVASACLIEIFCTAGALRKKYLDKS